MTILRVLATSMLIGLLSGGCGGSDDAKPPSASPKANAKAETEPETKPEAQASGPMTGPTGAVVRSQLLLLSATDFDAPPPEQLGFEFGVKAGQCTNIDPAPERDGLIAAIKASGDDAGEVDLSNPEVLVAACGNVHAAIAKWGSAESSISIDEFLRAGDGDWASTKGDHYPPCGLPKDVLVLWKLDAITC